MQLCPTCGGPLAIHDTYNSELGSIVTMYICKGERCPFKDQRERRLSREAFEEYRSFCERKQVAVERLRRIALTVLVMGPGPGRPGYEYRVHARDRLVDLGHNALFPEDEVDVIAVDNPLIQEMILAEMADWILILNISPGSLAESYDFTRYQEALDKVTVFCLDSHRGGYARQGWLSILGVDRAVVDVSEAELGNGQLLRRISEMAWGFQKAKYLRVKGLLAGKEAPHNG